MIVPKEYNKIFTKGLQSALNNTPIEDGKLRFTTDTGRLYIDIVEGEKSLSDYLNECDDEEFDRDFGKIKEGSRNATMSRFAAVILKKYGDTDKAYEAFIEKANKCEPPLEDSELEVIWRSAKNFFKKISSSGALFDVEKLINSSRNYYRSNCISCRSCVCTTSRA